MRIPASRSLNDLRDTFPLSINLASARSCVISTARMDASRKEKGCRPVLPFAPVSMLEHTACDEYAGKHGFP